MKGKFLYVKYIGKPRDPSQSAKKGYLKENMAWDERVSLSTKLTDKEILEASIVIDLENKKIIRQKRHSFDNWGGVSTEYDFLFNYFYEHYKNHIDKFLGTTDEKTVD
jgi:hypothetical protein